MLSDRILFIDGEALILDKPAGLPVDSPRDRSPSVESMLDELTFGFKRVPLPVHRLDRDTSGCLLLARNPKAHKRFQQAFEQGLVTKKYLAVIDGVPDEATGTVDMALAKVSTAETGWRMVGDPQGKRAVTHWEVLREHQGRALVAFTPETGRTHQIRVHASHGMGIPIVGDPVYGRADQRLVMLLHAVELSVPREGKPPVAATSELPERFALAGFGPVPVAVAEPSDQPSDPAGV
ncbi:RNA pseudouridine synthase [Sphingomonas sp. S1-29]|uniref:RluA family pseudouridine synthase n=1 Tax=Sphingomonas sp. S1-29 TaxID=2991074 RepID=UPI00223ED308|nr:RNA pseudouridine synthase [Sphingomonas sp. S1-29]UZK69202.1 RNA pseudouridine synthase [Sphingomonas sp. S1-29]